MSKDTLGDRMKSQYEDRTRYFIPRRTFGIIRLDGKSFHTYTRGLNKPFDEDLYEDIDNSIIEMMPQIQGAKFAYTQSDEISILLTDFDQINTSAWFDGNLQKMASVSASILTAEFNKQNWQRFINKKSMNLLGVENKTAYFDSRVFTIPDRIEVSNYFRWRQQDCIRNSVSMVAQSLFSHKELHGKNQSDMHEMMHSKGVNWATDYSDGEKNGRLIIKETSGERSVWKSIGAWVFNKNDDLLNMIPNYPT